MPIRRVAAAFMGAAVAVAPAAVMRRFDVLMHVANGLDESYYRRRLEGGKIVTECIPAKVPAASQDGQVRQFMPSVGYFCAPR